MPSATIFCASRSIAAASGRARSARAWPADMTPAATRRCTSGRQLEQAQGVGNLGTRTANPVGQLLMGGAEVLQQLLVSGGLFQGIELAAVQVLQQRIAEEVVIGGVTDNCGDGFKACSLDCPPAALTHDQLVGFATLFG